MPVDVSKLKPYRSAVEDNARWADFDPRPGDIYVCTPPKVGTTWTQAIVTSLLWPKGDQPGELMRVSPWPEAKFMPVEAVHAQLRAMTHRRCIKTHTPADGIPWYDDARYIHVARDGRDAFMSMCNHMERMSAQVKAGLNATIADDPDVARLPDWTGNPHDFFPMWLNGIAMLENVASYWTRAQQRNVLLVHFNDLKADLSGEMQRIADFLDIQVPSELWAQTVHRCTFEAMQNDEARMGKFETFAGGIRGFIFKGTNGRWKDVLTAEELAQYDEKLHAVLSPRAADWVTHGRAKLAGVANP
jgi:aryl sulfotransferase